MKRRLTNLVTGVLLAVVGTATVACSGEGTSVAWAPLPAAQAQAESADQMEVASQAIGGLGSQLMGALMSALGGGGPAAAIGVCQSEAPALASKVGTEHGVRLGRTSFRQRNGDNSPPEWARAAVMSETAEELTFRAEDGTLGLLRPILTMGTCLLCHGPEEAIAADVRAALAERYPDDRATGFESGDVRGYFWVEVPPTR